MIDLMSISLSHSINHSITHQPLSLTFILFFFIDSLIQFNNIEAEGARHISDALQHNSTITSIGLFVRVSHIEDSWGFLEESLI